MLRCCEIQNAVAEVAVAGGGDGFVVIVGAPANGCLLVIDGWPSKVDCSSDNVQKRTKIQEMKGERNSFAVKVFAVCVCVCAFT